jgi:hypothetical protein
MIRGWEDVDWVTEKWLTTVGEEIVNDTLLHLQRVVSDGGGFLFTVLGILSRHDPERLVVLGCPPDEYLNEADEIVRHLNDRQSVDDIAAIARDVFARQFDGRIPSAPEVWLAIGRQIWEARRAAYPFCQS